MISNYNDFFTTGTFSTSYATLAQWQTTSHDLNSVFIQPNFISSTDLHIAFNDTLNNRGDSLDITTDLDHVTRYAPQPDMGADEFDSSGVYDIGVAHFINPNGTDCNVMPYVTVSVKNYSSVPADTVKAFTLYLKINSAMIDTLSWTGILLPGDSVNVLATPLYYFVYAQNYQLKAWTSLPNNSLDSQIQNDTATLTTTQISMGGVYTIGGIDPDFHKWNEARDAIVSMGVCDSVIFNVRPGLYDEQLIFPPIQGAAYNRSITFRSETMDSASVVLFYRRRDILPVEADWMIHLDGADYFRFCNLSIGQYENINWEYRGIINIRHGATHNKFNNNVLYGRHNTSPSPYNGDGANFGTIRIIGDGNHDHKIERNRFVYGIYNVYVDSATPGNYVNNIIVRDNSIYDPRFSIFNLNYVDTLTVDNNIAKTNAAPIATYDALIELSDCRGPIKITRNQLYKNSKGISFMNCTGTAAEPILVSNNFYANISSAESRIYGIEIDSSHYINIIHNSISVPGRPFYSSGELYAGIVLREGSNINIWNNSIANYYGCLAVFTEHANTISSCDYNNYYTYRGRIANAPSNVSYPLASDTLHLNAWQALTGFDIHSTTVDPHFSYRNPNFNGTTDDLHLDPNNIVPLVSQLYFPNVSGDIDNDVRSTTTPTVGADEFTPGVNDANLAYLQPGPNICAGTNAIRVLLRNIGTQPLTTLTIAWSVNNVPQPSYNWTGSLNFADSTMVTIGSYNFPIGSSSITVISQMPNGSPDPTPLTDTLHYILSASLPPLPDLGPDIALCSTSTVFLTTTTTFNYYLWSEGSTTHNIIVGPGTWIVTVSNIIGCSNSDTIVISNGPAPPVSVSGNAAICAGSSTTLTASGATTYSWMPGNLSGTTVTVSPTVTTTYTVIGSTPAGCNNTFTFTVVVNPRPTVTVSGGTNICIGSPATITANGANTYSWMPGNLSGTAVSLNPSATTNYTVTGTSTVTGCSNTASFTITVNALPAITVSSPTIVCAGTPTTMTASGASTYSWMPGNLTGTSVVVNPLTTTTYTVTGTASSGCTNTQTRTITVNPSPVLTISASDTTICSGTPTTLLVSGAATYTWNPGNLSGSSVNVTPASTTTYTVSGTASGCTTTGNITIYVTPTPTVTINASAAAICTGDSATLIASGGGTYVWMPGNFTTSSILVAPVTTTTYTVTATNAGICSANTTQTITVNTTPIVTLNLAAVDTQCTWMGAFPLPSGTPAGGIFTGTAVTGNTFSPAFAGVGTFVITYTYTTANGCTASAHDTMYVDVCTGISPSQGEDVLIYYPNPVSNMLTIAHPHQAALEEITIYNALGEIVFAKQYSGSKVEIDMAEFSNGVYSIQVKYSGNTVTRKIIKVN